MSSIIPRIRTFLHRDQVLLDTMPLLMHIAVPNLRSVSVNLPEITVLSKLIANCY